MQPYDDPELDPIELGASIFVKANKNLWRATEEFGFERKDFDEGDTLGIWDGTEFRLMVRSFVMCERSTHSHLTVLDRIQQSRRLVGLAEGNLAIRLASAISHKVSVSHLFLLSLTERLTLSKCNQHD